MSAVAGPSSLPAVPSSPPPFTLAPASRPSSPTFDARQAALQQRAVKRDLNRRLTGSKSDCPIVPGLASTRVRGPFKTSPWAWIPRGNRAELAELELDELDGMVGLPRDEDEAGEWAQRRDRRRLALAAERAGKGPSDKPSQDSPAPVAKPAQQRQLTLTDSLMSNKSSISTPSIKNARAARPPPERAISDAQAGGSPPPAKRATTPPSSVPLASKQSLKRHSGSSPKLKAISRSASPGARGSPAVKTTGPLLGGGSIFPATEEEDEEADTQPLSFGISYDEGELKRKAEERGRSLGEDEEILAEFGCTQMVFNPPTQAEPTCLSPLRGTPEGLTYGSMELDSPPAVHTQPLSQLALNELGSKHAPLLDSPCAPLAPLKPLAAAGSHSFMSTPPPAPLAAPGKYRQLSSLVSTRDHSPGLGVGVRRSGASLLGDEIGDIAEFLRGDMED